MTSDFDVTPYDDISRDFDVTIDNYLDIFWSPLNILKF